MNRRTYGVGVLINVTIVFVAIILSVMALKSKIQATMAPANSPLVTLEDGSTVRFNIVVAYDACGESTSNDSCMSYWRLRGVSEEQFNAVVNPSPQQASSGSVLASLLGLALYLTLTVLGILRTRRRLHDIDQSSWLTLLILIPFVNGVFMIAILFIKGTDGWNRYGPPPAKRVSWSGLIGGKSAAA